MNKENKTKGTVLEIIRMSTEDGPGIRTTLFLKGCSLKCTWCHNPESISMKPQVQWIASRCIGCGTCLEVCPEGALSRGEEGIIIHRDRCTGCGTCAKECPGTAMELLGTEWDADALVVELLKDRAWFEKSGGGVTLSGGEAALQMDFSLDILQRLKAEGIHTALDTCGQVRWEVLETLLPHCDLVLYDIKEMDPQRHRTFTGAGNDLILENLLITAAFMKDHLLPSALWIRTPLIPGATATEENIKAIAGFLKKNIEGSFQRWELCAFNNLCRDKYHRLGMAWPFEDTPLLSREELDRLAAMAKEEDIKAESIAWTGSPRLEETEKTEDKNKPAAPGSSCYSPPEC